MSSRTVYYQGNETDEDQSFYILDIDAYNKQDVEPEKLEEVLNDLHYEIQLEFLANITDDYKQKMRRNGK